MPGHNALAELGQVQTGVEFDGKFLLVKNGEPSDGTSGDTGYSKGAIAINTACTGGGNALYYNEGTSASPTWVAATGE